MAKINSNAMKIDSTGKPTSASAVSNGMFRDIINAVDSVLGLSSPEISEFRRQANKFDILRYDLAKMKNDTALLKAKVIYTDAEKLQIMDLNKKADELRVSIRKMTQLKADHPDRKFDQEKLDAMEKDLATVNADIKAIVDSKVLTDADQIALDDLEKKIAESQAKYDRVMDTVVVDANREATWGAVKDPRLLIGVVYAIVALADLDHEILPKKATQATMPKASSDFDL